MGTNSVTPYSTTPDDTNGDVARYCSSSAAASWLKISKIIMTVPATLVTIPGSSALRTLLYFDEGNLLEAARNGIATTLTVIAIVAGLAGARMLTDPEWAFTKPDPPELGLRSLGWRRRRR